MLLPLRGVATPGHGEGEGSAVDKFRVSGTQETVEGAGANEVSGVLSEASCCRCFRYGALLSYSLDLKSE